MATLVNDRKSSGSESVDRVFGLLKSTLQPEPIAAEVDLSAESVVNPVAKISQQVAQGTDPQGRLSIQGPSNIVTAAMVCSDAAIQEPTSIVVSNLPQTVGKMQELGLDITKSPMAFRLTVGIEGIFQVEGYEERGVVQPGDTALGTYYEQEKLADRNITHVAETAVAQGRLLLARSSGFEMGQCPTFVANTVG